MKYLKFVAVLIIAVTCSVCTAHAAGFGSGSRIGSFGSGGFGSTSGSYTILSYESLSELCATLNADLAMGVYDNVAPFSSGAPKYCTLRQVHESTAIQWGSSLYSSYFVISVSYKGVYYNFKNPSGYAYIAFPFEEDNGGLRILFESVYSIKGYVDGIEGYLSGISSKLADISNKLDQLIGLSTAASALPSSYYDAIDVLGDITANYESSDDAILQRYFMNPDDPYPISPDFFSNLDRYAVYVTYDDLCKAVTKLNSIGYPSTVQYNSDLGVYYIWSNGYLMNMATHYGISGQQGIRKGYFVLAGYRFLASREKSVPSLLENISATLESVDQHLSGFSSVADIAVCTKSGASVVERKLVSTPFGFNLFYQSIQPCIGRTIKVYDGEAPVEGVLHKLYPLLVNNQYFLCASVMVGERYISDCYVLYPGFSSFACPTNPDLMDKLDELVNVLSSVTPVVTSINNNATSISSSLSRIETALSNLVCHHDYRSMLVLDGESVTFESAVGGEAIDDLTLKIEPEQDYNGYNRPWAGGAGKNLLDDTQRVFAGGNIFFGGATSATSGSSITLPAGTYTFSVITASGAVSNLYLKDKASNAYIAGFPSYDHRSQSFTLEETTELLAFVYCFNYTSVDDIVSAQIESGTAVTPYEPYENLAPLSGRTGMTVTHNGNATTIDWAETAGTVYGGTFDLASGVLTSSMSMISSYAGETLPARWYSDRDVYVAGTTPTLGAQVVYVTNEPITYQLDPVPIYAALGSNVITSDCGSMTLKILDGSNLTDMGYTLIVCQNCGQVQPMFDYSRLLDKLDALANYVQENGALLLSHSTATDTSLQTIISLLQENLTNSDTQAHEHSYTRHITQDATCTVPGLATYTCDECGYGYTELLPALGHDWDFTEHVDAVLDEEGEVLQPGYDIYTCTRCGHSYQDHDGTGAPEDSGQIGDLITSIFSRLGNLVGSAINGLLSAGDSFLTGLDDLAADFNEKIHQVESFGGNYPSWLSGFWDAIPVDLQLALSFCLIVTLIGICGKKLVFTS